MGPSRFGRQYPVVWGGKGGGGERERLMFIAAAGLAFSLLIIFFVVLNFRSDANAKTDQVQRIDALPVRAGTVTLLAPDRPVRAGEKLSDVRFKEIYWPRNQVPEGAIRDASEVSGMYARVDLSPDIPLQRGYVTTEASRVSLPVTPGNRAVAIEIDDISGSEGHILPGTRVDVVLTYHENNNLVSKIIVANARVISAGGDTTSVYERDRANQLAGGRRVNRTITLDVSVKDALQITTARKLGSLNLMMRAPEDDKGAPVTEITEADINQDKNRKQPSRAECRGGTRGIVKMGGREYMIECDGSMSLIAGNEVP